MSDKTAIRDFLLRRPQGYGVVAEGLPSIGSWQGDQALGLVPTACQQPSGMLSSRAEEKLRQPAPSLSAVKEALAKRESPTVDVKWLDFDFEVPPEPPSYMVDGLFERGTVNIVSSDTGAGKTWLSCSLIAAALGKTEWLGRSVEARRLIAIDEENPAAVIRARLRALGVTNEQVDCLRYSSRQGVSLGEAGWNAWLLGQAVEHGADLILVDTVMAATNISEVNDNTEAVSIYKGLRAIAEEADLAVVLFHHHRKTQAGRPRGGGQAMMGGRQWAGQADAHLTLQKKPTASEEVELAKGESRFKIELRVEKLRNGIEPPAEEIQIQTRNEDNCLVSASVQSLGAVTREPSKAEALGLKMRDALAESGPLKIGELAESLGETKSSGTWERARKQALEDGLIVKAGDGFGSYEAGEREPEL